MPKRWLREIVHELDHHHIPTQNVERIMRHVLDASAKIERDAKSLLQECASEFIGLVTDHAKTFMRDGTRKTVTGPDLVLAMEDLLFKPYSDLVRQFQWPDDGKPVDGSRKRKRSERPPPPLDQLLQLQRRGSIGKRLRGRSGSSSSLNSTSSSSSIAEQILALRMDEQEAFRVRFARVFTVHDLNLPAALRHPPAATLQSSSVLPATALPTTVAVDDNVTSPIATGNAASPIALLDDDDANWLHLCELHADVHGPQPPAPVVVPSRRQGRRLSRHADARRQAQQELKSVLSSPKLTFPKSEMLLRRTPAMSVRSVDPFSIEFVSLDLDTLSGNASLALDLAFSQLSAPGTC